MKAARVTSWATAPECVTVPDLPAPSPNELQLTMMAVGVPRVVQARAAGKHPTASDAPLPFDPSVDGVGRDDATGDLYYVNPLAAPLLAERANVDRSHLMKLAQGSDPTTVAALANPVSSSWMALQCRAVGGCSGRTVVIVGATSASGRAAAVVAHSLGAGRIIGLARNMETLATVDGLDDRIILREPFIMPKEVGPVHIMLDYVGGSSAVGLLQTAETEAGENLQYIQVGGIAAQEAPVLQLLPPRLINVKPIIIIGSGMGSFSKQDLKNEMPGLVSAIAKMETPFGIRTTSLDDVQSSWGVEDGQKRLVVLPSQ